MQPNAMADRGLIAQSNVALIWAHPQEVRYSKGTCRAPKRIATQEMSDEACLDT